MAEKTRWLRNIADGEIYGWNAILAENPRTEEVSRDLVRARDESGHFIADDPDTPENEAWKVDDTK